MEATDPTLQKLLLYTVDQVQQQGGTVTLTKLTKLLYLIDVEHYRQYGNGLTRLQWVFYRYGPWAFALPRALNQADIDLGEEEFVTPRGYKGRTFHVTAPQDITQFLAFRAKLVVDKVIRAWALEGTNFLLGYVYFHTEPMIHGTRGRPLEFDSIVRDVADDRISIPIGRDKAPEIRRKLLQTLRQINAGFMRVGDERDQAYLEAMRLMDQQGSFSLRLGHAPEASPEVLELLAGPHD